MPAPNMMVAPSPSPYRNLQRDIETQDQNADGLQPGIDDAKARFQAASQQYHATQGIPEKAIYDKAYQDLLDRTNAAERSRSKARELEIQAKVPPSKVNTSNFSTPEGGQGIEFNEGLNMQSKPKPSPTPTSGLDLSSLLRMAGNSIYPSAEASTLKGASNPQVAQDPTTLGPYSGPNKFPPPAAPATPQNMAQKAASAVQTLRASGVGAIGDKASVSGTSKGATTDTRPYVLDANDIESIGGAIRQTPEWQRQSAGLDDLDNLVQLQAQRNAKKTSLDLSPLGAYLDYRNAQQGAPTKLASEFKGPEVEDTSFKDMGDIQRRRADLAKELVNTVKASKFGTFSANDAYNLAYSGGITPNNLAMQHARFGLSGIQDLKKATDAGYKDNDEQLKAINTIAQRVANSANNPAESGSIPALLEVMDTGSKRILAGVLGMEGYDPSIPGQISSAFTKATKGMIPEQQRAYLQDRLQRAAQRATDQRGAIHEDLHNYARSLPVSPTDVQNIVDSHHNMPNKGFPTAVRAGVGGSAAGATPENKQAQDQSDFQAFMKMMKEHEAGK